MAKASVPLVPGYQGRDKTRNCCSAGRCHQLTRAHQGQRRRAAGHAPGRKSGDFAAARSCKREAINGSNDAVLVEKYVLRPRHIEIRCLAIRGNCVYLFERDCSVQRRHQGAGRSPRSRHDARAARGWARRPWPQPRPWAMWARARSIHRRAAGRLRRTRPWFYFMEMNTRRLQVEHPVTEGDYRRRPGGVAAARGQRPAFAQTPGRAAHHQPRHRGAHLRRTRTTTSPPPGA